MKDISLFFITKEHSAPCNEAVIGDKVIEDNREFKFLYWKEINLLIVGNMKFHEDLLRVFLSLKEEYKDKLNDCRPDGAGKYAGMKIQSWGSAHFNFITEESLKEEILQVLSGVEYR